MFDTSAFGADLLADILAKAKAAGYAFARFDCPSQADRSAARSRPLPHLLQRQSPRTRRPPGTRLDALRLGF